MWCFEESTSNKEGKVICELEVRVLGGMQFGVLVDAVLGESNLGCWWRCRFARLTAGCWHAVWGAGGCCFGGIQLGLLVEAALRDWRPGAGMQFGVLVDAVLRA